MIQKLLVANRGEIACRVFETCRKLAIQTVAVYSDADAKLRFVRDADEAFRLGLPPASESYLLADRILEIAVENGVDAIHPGYGFLSERPSFALACSKAGIQFIGPSADSMQKLGTKSDAKRLAREADVPTVPGYEGDDDMNLIHAAAERIGYPVMLKASSGGGGRGMRIVHDPARLEEEFRLASYEALKSFGDGAMLVEKYVANPRHVEVQFIADSHGNIATLFERECSIQRRHQKLIEEAPAAREVNWDGLRDATRRLVLAADYQNAGTAEFIVDPRTGDFYFLEVNARLQVEHPVTESITGLDLVEQQIRVANGQPLDIPAEIMSGDRGTIKGHAIEVRVVAENPSKGFVPSLGKIVQLLPSRTPGIRIDSGFESGDDVTRFYDSMIAKAIAHGDSREQAIERLRDALADFHVLGVDTNVGLMLDITDSEAFRSGHIHTGTLSEFLETWKSPEPLPEFADVAAELLTSSPRRENERGCTPAWSLKDGFRNVRS
jgi:3-methylcrotonyl-CoA carboxylase alpha subunit